MSSIFLTSCKPPFHRILKGVGTSIEFDLDSIHDVPYSQDTRVSGAYCYKDTIVCNEERHLNSIVTDIQKIQNGGGSIYGIICADNQRELSYIRYACLLEDLAVLNTTSPQKSSLKDNLYIDSLYIEMRKCRPSVLAHAIRENEVLSEHDAASRAKYLNEAYSFPVSNFAN